VREQVMQELLCELRPSRMTRIMANTKRFDLRTTLALSDQLDEIHVNRAEPKSNFAIGEVVLPHSPEPLVEAERLDLRLRVDKPVSPLAKGPGITVAKRVLVGKLQADTSRLPLDVRQCRQHAARKDTALDEVRALPICGITALGNGDDLRDGNAAIG
jgi:hypothetical protein